MSNLKNMVQMNLSIKQNFLKYKSSRAILQFSGFPPPLFFFLIFIWLCQALVATHRIFSCGMWDLVLWPGFEPAPLHWGHGVLHTGLPGKFPHFAFSLALVSLPPASYSPPYESAILWITFEHFYKLFLCFLEWVNEWSCSLVSDSLRPHGL